MFKKLLTSFSTLSLFLTSGATLAGILTPELPEEKAIAIIHKKLNQDPQQTLTHAAKVFVKGEVPGDGGCLFHSLNVLLPEKEINRSKFIEKINQSFESPPKEADSVKEELAREFFYSLKENIWTTEENTYFKGNASQGLKNLFDLEKIDQCVDKIKRNKNAMVYILNTLSNSEKMLSLPPDSHSLGSFGPACKLFKINLDVFTIIPGSDRLEIRQQFKFGDNEQTHSVLFSPTAAHVSPLCEISDALMRKRLASRILQMIQKGEGIYKTFDEKVRTALLGATPSKDEQEAKRQPLPFPNTTSTSPAEIRTTEFDDEDEKELYLLALALVRADLKAFPPPTTSKATGINPKDLFDTLFKTYHEIRLLGNNAPDEELIKYILKEIGYGNWDRLTRADQLCIITMTIRKQ